MNHNSATSFVIIGAGPAGLAAARRLVDSGEHSVLVLEAGEDLSRRSQTSMVNGFGGAGLYSDRKFSALPAGTGLLSQNVYELRDSFEHVLRRLQNVLATKDDGQPPCQETVYDKTIDELLASTRACLGGQDMSSEHVERTASGHSGPLKLYPSLVLKDVADAEKIINAFLVPMVINGVTVRDIRRLETETQYTVTYDCLGQQTHIKADYVLMATGRFGPWSWPPGLGALCPGRLEIGLRVELSSCRALMDALKATGVPDPKYCLDTTVNVEGWPVPCQVRTFCVCTTGYMAYCHDGVTGCWAVSASSSVSELQLRSQVVDGTASRFKAEPSVGIMIRWTDPAFVLQWRDLVKDMCRQEPFRFSLNLANDLEGCQDLQACFPPALCAAILQGTREMLQTILKTDCPQGIVVHGPCMEGAGAYPSPELPSRVFVAGDLGGRSRGLLQALVDGDMAAKRMMCHDLDARLHAQNLLHKYQSVYLPGHVYNKTLVLSRTPVDWAELYAKMCQTCHVYFDTFLRDLDVCMPREELFDLDARGMHAVRHTGSFGVLYELHHFFLDDAARVATGGLHVISERSLLHYMLACNAIQTCLAQLGTAAFRLADKTGNCDTEAMFTAHQFKACVLALRTRPSVAERGDYTDLPIMQSAYKLLPKRPTTQEDVKLVAATATLLDCCFRALIAEHGLQISLHRTKIETQEPGVVSCDQILNPPYLECHVKLNMRKRNGSKLSYQAKKEAIQDVASLFEGEGAVHAGIFRVLAVSINLLKHPEHGQQFFLTFRTDEKADMRTMRRHFAELVRRAVEGSDLNLTCTCIPDAEVVVYDNRRDMDLGWFPVTHDFLEPDYASKLQNMISNCK